MKRKVFEEKTIGCIIRYRTVKIQRKEKDMGSIRIYQRKFIKNFPFIEKIFILNIEKKDLPFTLHCTNNGWEIKGQHYPEHLYLEAYGYRILSWMNKQEQKLSLIPNLLSLGRVCLVYRPGTKVIVK